MKSGDEMELAQNRFMAGEGSDRSAAMNRQRAGLSEVIAALLILVISVAIGTIFFAWGTSALNLTQSGFIQQTALSRDKIEERITVTSVFYNTTVSANVSIAVFNYGERAATIDTVYLNQTPYDFDVLYANRSTDFSSNMIPVGELVWIRIPVVGLAGTTSTITLATERGNSYELLFKA